MKYTTFLIASFLFITVSASADEWQLIRKSDGIKVFNKKTEWSDFKAFRAEATLEVAMATLIEVFNDIPLQTEWMADCSESRCIAHPDSTNWIIYTVTSVPWPLNDRDAVWRRKATVNNADGSYLLEFSALSDTIVPYVRNRVRMIRSEGFWRFHPIQPHRTAVIYQFQGDPGGRIPKGLANFSSQSIPFRTMQGLRKMIRKKTTR